MSAKSNLNDVTFLLRIRVDSVDRLENLLIITDYLSTHFDTNIHVLESRSYNNSVLERLLSKEIMYTYVEDYDPVFYQTKFINQMVRNCESNFFSIWDVDSIVPPKQIIQSVDLLRKDKADFVSPYKDKAWDTSRIIKELYVKTKDIQVLIENIGKMNLFHPPKILFGGGIFALKKAFFNAGMDNERCYGWGGEDDERVIRLKILGFRYKRVSGPLFHLTHERGMNSRYHSSEQMNVMITEIKRIQSMSRQELEDEIKIWKIM